MATSGQLNTNTVYDSYFFVKWRQGDQDIAQNYTQVYWSCGVYCGHNFYSNAIKMSAVSINGKQVYGGGTYSNFYEGEHIIASDHIWIQHDANGAKNFSISAFTGWLYQNNNYSCNGGNFELTPIPRKATITSAPDFTDLDNPTITFSNPGGFTMDVWLEPNPVGDHLCIRQGIANTGSYTWELSDEERKLLRNSCWGKPSCKIRLGLYSYVNGVQEASYADKTFTMALSDATEPAVDADFPYDNSSLNKDHSRYESLASKFIQGKTRLKVKISAEGKYGANITNYISSIDGKVYYSQEFTSDVIVNSGNRIFSFGASDSRGFSGAFTRSISVTPYSKPLVVPVGDDNAITCFRSDGNGVRVGNSTSVWIKAKMTFSPVEGENACALQWRRKEASVDWNDSEHLWNDLKQETVNADSAFTEYNALLPNEEFERTKSYTVQIRAIDAVGEQDIKTFEIPTEDVALHLGKGGKNVAVGTYCNGLPDYRFYSDWVGQFDKGLWGASLNFNVTDVLEFPKECADGITPIIINDSTNKDNLPDGHYDYSVGIIHKRTADQYNVILMDYQTGKIAINVHLSGTWTGWKYITPQ